jgi:Domain of unknown function DUF29
MNGAALYDDDILEWSEQQAAALRHLAKTRPGVSNEIDWDNVAEEIESVGRSEYAPVQSFVRLMLVHVIKAVSVTETSSILHWRKEVVSFHRDVLDRITPSMRSRLDIDRLWQQARKQAEADLAVYGQHVAPSLPEQCVLEVRELINPDFDFLATIEAVRKRMSEGT